jgi:CheY-like chemotaxis protein
LFLVRDLVELHGGEVRARNRGMTEGEAGAVFVARFPLHTGQADLPPPASVPLTTLEPELDGLRVLVVDHDPDARELLTTILERHGAFVRTVGSVADALEALESWRPDVLVSDSATPQHESYAVVGKVRSLESDRGGRIPAAALTVFSRTDERVRRMLAAFQRELPKPIEPAVLAAEVARLAGRGRSRFERTH